MNIHIRKLEKSQVNTLVIHLKVLEKQEQANPKIVQRNYEK
jgi:hypothetical protein